MKHPILALALITATVSALVGSDSVIADALTRSRDFLSVPPPRVIDAMLHVLGFDANNLLYHRSSGIGYGSISAAQQLGAVVITAQQAQPAVRKPVRAPDVAYEPSPDVVVNAMLELAEVGAGDVVYDLGSGDGRIVITAAKKFGARGLGVDIDPQRIAEANANAREAGVTDKVKFIEGDLFETDLSPATVVTMFLWPSINMKLRPKLQALKPGTRIVSHWHDLGDWKPQKSVIVKGPRYNHPVYLWVVPPSSLKGDLAR